MAHVKSFFNLLASNTPCWDMGMCCHVFSKSILASFLMFFDVLLVGKHILDHDRMVVNISAMPKCNFNNVAGSNNYAASNGSRPKHGNRPNMNPSFGECPVLPNNSISI